MTKEEECKVKISQMQQAMCTPHSHIEAFMKEKLQKVATKDK